MANTALNRSEVLLLTNKSGGSVAQGDVVIIDSTTAASFTTTTTGAYAAGKIGVVIDPNGIANNAIGLVAFSGYVPKVTLSGAASLGDLFKTHTVAKQAVRHASPAVAGDFGEVLGTGTTPAAVLWGLPVGAAGAGTIGGSTGAADNAIIRADGVGGATIQNSLATVDDTGTINIPTGQTYNINGSAHTHAGGGSGVTVLAPSSDAYIDSQAATTNYDTAAQLITGNYWGTSSFTRFALFTFDISSLAGKTIGSAILSLFKTTDNMTASTVDSLRAVKILRAYVADQVTWNAYSTGNNWTTAGAQSAGNDISAEYYGHAIRLNNFVPQEFQIDIGRMLQAALDASETTLRVKVGQDGTDGGTNTILFASLEHATTAYRPKLRVAYA